MSRKAFNNKGQDSGKVWIYGKHSVFAALENPARQITRVIATKNVVNDYRQYLPSNVEIMDDSRIAALVGKDAVHQGLAIQASPLENLDLREVDLGNLVVLLDQVTDPHNVGAIIRSASAFGASAVITTERNSPEANSILAKSASGGLEYINYIRVGNLSEAMEYLKKENFWLIGMAGDTKDSIDKIREYEKVAIVMGAEGTGMRHKTRENCDLVVRIDMSERQESLNVSNAAAIALWEASKRKV